MTKEIKLTQGKVVLVDDEDFEYLNQWKWCVRKDHNTFYALRRGIKSEGILWRKTILMHRDIISTPKRKITDHINGNGLDNRKENLRICNHTESNRNRKLQKNNTSGYKGVHKIKFNEYRAKIYINGKVKYLGTYNILEEAAKAYNEAALIHHGEFARLNIIK